MQDIGTVTPIKIEDEMRSSYLDYAMSVIVSRALPDVRDGLKPVHRRILYAMHDLGLRSNTAHKKSARVVGEVLGKFHPHGDASVYDAMVRMAQDFSMRYPLVDGQGNFGSVDNDPPAAMRYTEVRLAAIAEEMLANIDEDTVNFVPNFDDSLEEPSVLPARLPNLLVNGASGIAVGMTTSIPPHNLGEVCDAAGHLIDNPDATVDDLLRFVPGPDFPTAATIQGREGIHNAYAQGHGRIVVRARARLEETSRSGRSQIVITELPYQTNKAALVERIADLVRSKRIEGIAELRDESDRQGMRVVIELRREAQAQSVLNNLYKHTALQSAFFVNMLALVDGQPRVISLKAALQHYINYRRDVLARRSRFQLKKAQERAHILEGLKIALDNLDRVINTIRRSQTVEAARENLMTTFKLSQVQVQAILDMQLRRLAALERRKIEDELLEVLKNIAYLEDLLANPQKIDYLIKEDLRDLKSKYSGARRTRISEEEAVDFAQEDLVGHQQVAIAVSNRGYIKRVPADTYRVQRRGGRGVSGMPPREKDDLRHLLVADTHDDVFFFTEKGRVFRHRAYDIPEATRQARGTPLINLISIDVGERITALVAVPSAAQGRFMVMATLRGEVKKTPLADFANVRSNGLNAMDLEGDDELIGVAVVSNDDDLLLATAQGKAIRFAVSDLRSASRQSGGVRGIRLAKGDRVVGMGPVEPGGMLLTITTNGHGKCTPLDLYTRHGRGGAGVINFKMTPATGPVVAAQVIQPHGEVMIISAEGIIIRMQADEISTQGRAAQGVRVMRTDSGDTVASVAWLDDFQADPKRHPSSKTSAH